MADADIFIAVHIGHNASAALMIGGEVVAAAEEERFTRAKNEAGLPVNAMDFCLAQAGVPGTAVTAAAYSSVSLQPLEVKPKISNNFTVRDYHDYHGERYYARRFRGEPVFDYLKWLRDDPRFNRSSAGFDFSFLTDAALADPSLVADQWVEECRNRLAGHLGIPPGRVQFLDHHTCHAYYTYFAAPCRGQPAIVVVLDGMGDGRNLTVWRADDDRLELISESAENDIGRLYRMVTMILGMKPLEHEYKVMGLAPYAKESHAQACLERFQHISRVDGMRIVEDRRPQDLYRFLCDALMDQRFDNIGAATQAFTENLAVELIANIHGETGISIFALGGGIAMNVKMNKRIAELDCVSMLHVPASGADESLSIGGLYCLNREGANRPLENMYLGYDAGQDHAGFDWASAGERFHIRHKVDNRMVAELLRAGDIVGRIDGRCEFGQRALGNRSILADPSRADTVQRINEAVKKRDFWMPFAVSILAEAADIYIDNPKGIPASFMTLAFDTRSERYADIVAGTHAYDRTVRPQLVSRESAPAYHALISEFEAVSGIPALLNTSFNLHGEPIVNTLADALRTFEKSGIDHLLAGDTLVSKRAPG